MERLSKSSSTRDIEQLAKLLDTQFRFPGTDFRFGLDALIGLIPGIGDAATGGLGLYIIGRARQEGASGFMISKMLGNLAIDTVIGSIPLVGDLFDLGFKANKKNVDMLRRHVEKRDAGPVVDGESGRVVS